MYKCFKIWNLILFQKINVPAGNCFWNFFFFIFSTFLTLKHFYSEFYVFKKEGEEKECLFCWFWDHYRLGFTGHFGFFENINFWHSNLSLFGLYACNKISDQNFILTGILIFFRSFLYFLSWFTFVLSFFAFILLF